MNNNPLTLPKDFWRDEKYTDVLWIATPEGGGHEVWIEVEDTRWLFSSIMPMNYPAVDVSVVEISRDELAAKLHHNCDWLVGGEGRRRSLRGSSAGRGGHHPVHRANRRSRRRLRPKAQCRCMSNVKSTSGSSSWKRPRQPGRKCSRKCKARQFVSDWSAQSRGQPCLRFSFAVASFARSSRRWARTMRTVCLKT